MSDLRELRVLCFFLLSFLLLGGELDGESAERLLALQHLQLQAVQISPSLFQPLLQVLHGEKTPNDFNELKFHLFQAETAKGA
jgi:hypothetical protein